MLIKGYEYDEPSYSEDEKEEDKEKEIIVEEEEEEGLEKIPKIPKYVQKNHSKDKIIGDKRKCMLTRSKHFMIEGETNFYLI